MLLRQSALRSGTYADNVIVDYFQAYHTRTIGCGSLHVNSHAVAFSLHGCIGA